MYKIVSVGIAFSMVIGTFAWAVPPTIHVAWDESPAPVEDFDYVIDDSDPDFPNVELINGSLTWRVWSTDTDNPNDIGDIGVISSPHPENFGVRVVSARVVKGIDLDPTNAANYSELGASTITGGLNGDLFLQKSSGGTGGNIVDDVSISNGATGTLVFEELAATMEIFGTLSGSISCAVLSETLVLGSVSGDIAIGELNGFFEILGTIASTAEIDIDTMDDEAIMLCLQGFSGAMSLGNGVPGYLAIWGTAGAGSLVDLNGSGVSGVLGFAGGQVTIVDGGEVSGDVDLAGSATIGYSGSSTFASITSTGSISTATGADCDGEIEISEACAGVISIGGDLSGSGVIRVDGEFAEGSNIAILGDLVGNVTLRSSAAGSVQVAGAVSGSIVVYEAMEGSIDIDGAMTGSGLIDIAGDCTGDVIVGGQMGSQTKILLESDLASAGSIAVGGLLDGDIVINGDCSGDIALASAMRYGSSITVGDDLAGALSINGNVNGDIAVAGDLTGAIGAAYSLTTTGRILIDGACAGGITIGRDTSSTSLIRAIGGLTSAASIIINDDAGDYDANGIIHIGALETGETLEPVTFDGAICIKNYGTTGGDLNGTIRVVGCHATTDPLNICIGGANNGSVIIDQNGCANPVTWTCISACDG